jgi:excisionase family DNA binding protein
MDNLMTAADAARALGVTPAAVRRMEQRGTLRAVLRTAGGIRLFSKTDVDALAAVRIERANSPTASGPVGSSR